MTAPSLELTVIGAGPAYTNRLGATGAAYLVRGNGSAILLDLGQGSFPRLATETDPSRLDAVVISHLHPDHFIDLVPLRHFLAYQFQPPRRLRVLGPIGLAQRIDALHARPGFTAEALDCERLEEGSESVGGLTVEARRVTHTEDSYAVRVSGPTGPGLVYSGDCGVADDLAPLVRRGDALLVEVSFGAGPVPPGALHLDAPAIAGLVRATHPGRVLLTHLQMGFDPDAAVRIVAAATDAEVRLVAPGEQIAVGT
ncbi:MAG TPA: MBL fold metallo-hydrolase [Verrucomicrobiae bacterium]|nr:MBL fold metallo-hydrolase [Verrucomicrobiae bacterium]